MEVWKDGKMQHITLDPMMEKVEIDNKTYEGRITDFHLDMCQPKEFLYSDSSSVQYEDCIALQKQAQYGRMKYKILSKTCNFASRVRVYTYQTSITFILKFLKYITIWMVYATI